MIEVEDVSQKACVSALRHYDEYLRAGFEPMLVGRMPLRKICARCAYSALQVRAAANVTKVIGIAIQRTYH